MERIPLIAWMVLHAGVAEALRAAPTVFPTGTTIYEPDTAWNGFTVLSTLDTPAVLVIDMNGRTVKRWDGFNVSAGGPARILPGGVLIAPSGAFPRHQEATALVAAGFEGAAADLDDAVAARRLRIHAAKTLSVANCRGGRSARPAGRPSRSCRPP